MPEQPRSRRRPRYKKGDQISPSRGDKQGGEMVGEHTDDVLERFRWFNATRVGKDGRIDPTQYLNASRLRHKLEHERLAGETRRNLGHDGPPPPAPPGPAGAVNWTPLGPSVVAHGQATTDPSVSGRITSLAVGPGGTRVYAGSANGGVWYSGDAGTTWEPLEDYLPSGVAPVGVEADSLAVGAIAVRFGATRLDDLIYVGMGEANRNFDAYFGVGVRRFGPPPSGGPAEWSLEAMDNLAGAGFFRLIIDVDNPERVYAATSFGLFVRPPGGGRNWTRLTPPVTPPSSFATDVAAASTGTNRLYYVAFLGGIVWAHNPNPNPETGNWTRLTGITAAADERIALAATRVPPPAGANQRVIYAFTQGGRLYQLPAGVPNTVFVEVSGVPPVFEGPLGGQGWYDIAVEIEPGTANTIWLAGDFRDSGANDFDLSLWRGTVTPGPVFDYGFMNGANPKADATYMGRGVHADGHAIAFPSDGVSSSVWVGCDGGVFRSNTPGTPSSFQPSNVGLAITQMTFLAQRVDTDALVFGGCQDNGSLRFRGDAAWFESPAGDGGGVVIDPNNQYRVLRQYIRTTLDRAIDGGLGPASWSHVPFPPVGSTPTAAQLTAANTEAGNTGFYSPIVATDDGGATLAAFGTNRVWLTNDWGSSWNTLPTNTNPYAGVGTNLSQDVLDGTSVVALAFASRTRLFAATAFTVSRFDRSGTTWAKSSVIGLPPDVVGPITDITVENATIGGTGSIYATLGGNTPSHLYYFPGGSAASWIDAGLGAGGPPLNVPCHAVVVDPLRPQEVYVGSDIGCWKGVKSPVGTWTWNLFSQGLPEVAITDLVVHERARLLRAATHGRGVWEIELDASSLSSPELYLRVNSADTGRLRGPGGTRQPWVENHPDPTRVGAKVFHWMSPDIKVRRPSLSGLPPLSSPPDFLDFAENIGDYVDTGNVETADPTNSRMFVQVHNRSLTSIPGADVRVLLLLTDATAGLPQLPPGYAGHVVNGDPATRAPGGWLAGSAWFPADAAIPYNTLAATLDARTPQVVDFNVNIASLNLPATHDHVCAAAFATTISNADRLTATEPSLDVLTMRDRHVVHRNLHIVAAGSRPTPKGGFAVGPQTLILDAYNALEVAERTELIFHLTQLKGQLSLLLSRSGPQASAELDGLKAVAVQDLGAALSKHWKRWTTAVEKLLKEAGLPLEWPVDFNQAQSLLKELQARGFGQELRSWRLLKLASLDRTTAYLAGGGADAVVRLTMPGSGRVTTALTWVPPRGSTPGDQYRFDVVQRTDKGIVGGSTYVLGVVDTKQ